uniref:F-box domain-containing protein n=1 Tax=Davidia involucrata TaxID=16924 RepID=A0A5B7BNK8_DAVIN
MSDYLPREVLVDIISRLPVKSLLRFRCVSKSWCSLIESPNFIATHLNQSIINNNNNNNNTHLLIRHFSVNTRKEHYSLRLDTETLDECVELKCPFKTRSGNFFRVVGSCNGLICLSDDHFGYTYSLIIWNPVTRRSVTLPKPGICFDVCGPYMGALGFGFDPQTNDYKVVRLSFLQNKMGSWDTSAGPRSLLFGGEGGYIAPPEVEVFALSTGSWKTIDSAGVPHYNMIEYFWSSAFVNGKIHWLAYNRRDDCNRSYHNTIMSFDVVREVFGEVDLPRKLAGKYPLNMTIGVFGDTLSVFQYDDRAMSKCCSMWIMRQYGVAESWSKQFNVNLQGGLGAVLGFRKNGELLLTRRGGEVVSYNSSNKAIKNLGICGAARDSVFVVTYLESLVLLDGVNGVLGAQVESCDTVGSEEVPVSGARNGQAVADALEEHSLMHNLFSAHFLSY